MKNPFQYPKMKLNMASFLPCSLQQNLEIFSFHNIDIREVKIFDHIENN